MKKHKNLKVRSLHISVPLWCMRLKGIHDAKQGDRYHDTNSRLNEFTENKVFQYKKYRSRLNATLMRYADRNCIAGDSERIIMSLHDNKSRYILNGEERDKDKVLREAREQQLKNSLLAVSNLAKQAENVVNTALEKREQKIDSQIRAYYSGVAKFLRERTNYKKTFDFNKASLRAFIGSEDQNITDKLEVEAPEMRKAVKEIFNK